MSATQKREFPVLPVLAVLALIPAMLMVRQSASEQCARGQQYEDVYYLPPASWLRPMSLGYSAAGADLLWMRTLLYFGDELGHRGQTANIFNYIDAILELDPEFKAAYRWASTAGIYHSGTIRASDGYRVVEYLERAVKKWPDDGDLAWDLGATLRFELAPMVDDPAEKRRLHEAAMEPLATAARLGAGPPWLASLNAQLLSRLGRNEQAIRHLEEMYDAVSDPVEKDQLRLQLIKLRSESHATAFQAANDELTQSRQRNYPYLSSNQFLLVGPRIAEARNDTLRRNFLPIEADFSGSPELGDIQED